LFGKVTYLIKSVLKKTLVVVGRYLRALLRMEPSKFGDAAQPFKGT
jgi:hypothetical protein